MILIALGANLASRQGAPAATLEFVLALLPSRGIKISAVSPFYRTPAWPDPHDPPFVNAVARVETMLTPPALLACLHEIEMGLGRKRSIRNAPRTLDLDLIDYDGRIEAGPPVLPHPRVEDRAFVLIPLADVAPQWRHPVTGRSVRDLISALPAEERALIHRTVE